ncbi:VPLPA-CTERM sorting domain-containing protein [Desulfosarcina ovata]|nr:VPLPA-CTERM sorting domain-containing protein [Desulfosarcina ovata]
MAVPALASPFATEVVSATVTTTSTLYDDPESVLGKPTTWIKGSDVGGVDMAASMAYPAWNTDPDGNELIVTLSPGDQITVTFDHDIVDDPNNPYGIDFIVYGNDLYWGSGMVYSDTDMDEYYISTGGGWSDPGVVSVAQYEDGPWYTFTTGPYFDTTTYPTQAFAWDSENDTWGDELDWTKPVDPDLDPTEDFAGLSVAEVIDLYDGSAGGTGYDLADLYDLYGVELEWIRYIRVESNGTSYCEVDGFADVAAVPVPAAVWLLGSGLLGLFGIRRKMKV